MVFALGKISFSIFIWSATGVRSEVPDTFPPGSSLDATSPEPAGSVTAETRIGISVVLLAAA